MCLVALALGRSDELPLVVVANRDEFHSRPALPVGFWPDAPAVLAGRDLAGSGTWMGVTRDGRFAALTNVRDPRRNRKDVRSRGELVASYLTGSALPREHLAAVAARADEYNPFNLIVGRLAGSAPELLALGSDSPLVELAWPGVYGVSNGAFDEPWPKVERAKAGLLQRIHAADGRTAEFLGLLLDRSRPPDAALPDTGVGLELERVLSSIFIDTPAYGTRASTALVLGRDGLVELTEVTHQPSRPSVSQVSFRIAMR